MEAAQLAAFHIQLEQDSSGKGTSANKVVQLRNRDGDGPMARDCGKGWNQTSRSGCGERLEQRCGAALTAERDGVHPERNAGQLQGALDGLRQAGLRFNRHNESPRANQTGRGKREGTVIGAAIHERIAWPKQRRDLGFRFLHLAGNTQKPRIVKIQKDGGVPQR